MRAFLAVLFVCLFAVPADAAPGASASTSCLPGPLKRKLAEVSRKCGPIDYVSTHRPGARIKGSGKISAHASCAAADITVRNKRCALDVLRSNRIGCVLTYSNMPHIHADYGRCMRRG